MQLSQEERTWGMFAHLAGLAMFTAIPAGNVIGPLIVWLIKKEEMPFVDLQAKEAMNFQITIIIYYIISAILTLACIGYFMLLAVVVLQLVFIIVAALEANKGFPYRYPLTIRFIR